MSENCPSGPPAVWLADRMRGWPQKPSDLSVEEAVYLIREALPYVERAARPLDIEAGVRAIREAIDARVYASQKAYYPGPQIDVRDAAEAAFRTWAREQQGGA